MYTDNIFIFKTHLKCIMLKVFFVIFIDECRFVFQPEIYLLSVHIIHFYL